MLVAVGCDEGVWIGVRHDVKTLRKVLHVKAVTSIAVLEEFGIFLVLQDKVSRSDLLSLASLTHCLESAGISSGSTCAICFISTSPSCTSAAQPR